MMRVSQRQPQSCVECTRRKTKCNKEVPCSACSKRGVSDKCRLEQILPSKTLRTSSGMKKFREETNASQALLEARIRDLEAVIQRIHDPSITSPTLSLRGTSSSLTVELPDIQSAEDDEEDGGMGDDEAEAAGTLEFLALGRTRGKSPGGLGEEVIDEETAMVQEGREWIAPEWLVKAVETHDVSDNARGDRATDQDQTSSRPTRVSDDRHQILGNLPSVAVSRVLVQFDIDNVSWMHCCYHGLVFQSECDLFWSEMNAADVEVNWSFVALLFAVLASAVHHMPVATLETLMPGVVPKTVLSQLFASSLSALHRANWMHSHSLYAVQTVAILVSPANHLDKADLYFTMLGTAIRIAEALNLHRLGADKPAAKVSIAREVRKRVWHQLLIQDWFHVAFNGTNSIHASQTNTPLPQHISDSTRNPTVLPADVPSPDSHIVYLSQTAAIVNRVYSHSWDFKPPPYDQVLRADADMSHLQTLIPVWMRDENVELDAAWPWWVQWQRFAFMISFSHKVIIIHRPYLGRAFNEDRDGQYVKSRTASLFHAHRIISLFQRCALDCFRKTWTVLAHVIAAALVILVEAAHDTTAADPSEMLRPVQDLMPIFEQHATSSDLARKGLAVLRSLLRASNLLEEDDEVSRSFVGSAGKDLQRAIGVMRRRRAGQGAARRAETDVGMVIDAEPISQTPIWHAHRFASAFSPPTPAGGRGGDGAFGDDANDDQPLIDLASGEDLFDTLFGLGHDTGLAPWES